MNEQKKMFLIKNLKYGISRYRRIFLTRQTESFVFHFLFFYVGTFYLISSGSIGAFDLDIKCIRKVKEGKNDKTLRNPSEAFIVHDRKKEL
jgi:hypothetical protein